MLLTPQIPITSVRFGISKLKLFSSRQISFIEKIRLAQTHIVFRCGLFLCRYSIFPDFIFHGCGLDITENKVTSNITTILLGFVFRTKPSLVISLLFPKAFSQNVSLYS